MKNCMVRKFSCCFVSNISILLFLQLLFLIAFPIKSFCQEAQQKTTSEQKSDKIGNLTILSESNLSYPLIKIARLYSQISKSIVSVDFGDSADLIKNIEDGEPADIFISPHPDWLESLKRRGLVDIYNIVNVVKDRLVLITAKNNSNINISKLSSNLSNKDLFKEIQNQNFTFIIDQKNTSIKRYVDSLLKEAEVSNKIILYKNNSDKQAVANLIAKNDKYCGIILESEARNYDNINILKVINSEEIHYQGLVITGNNMAQARNFLEFITSNQAKEIFSQNGFVID